MEGFPHGKIGKESFEHHPSLDQGCTFRSSKRINYSLSLVTKLYESPDPDSVKGVLGPESALPGKTGLWLSRRKPVGQ